MPYIESNDRARAAIQPRTPGELNYAITSLMIGYLERKGLNYTYINDCLGALDGAGKEFYRRVAITYEHRKIQENGDVYPETLTQGG
jgi:hypothetical protein